MFGKSKKHYCPYIKDCSKGDKKSDLCKTGYENCMLYKSRESVEEPESQKKGELEKLAE